GLNSETWEWNGTNWSLLNVATPPQARRWHTVAYDSSRGVVVLFGGQGSGSLRLNDTWEFGCAPPPVIDEFIVFPGDPIWGSFIPAAGGFAGVTASNPKSGTGSLELTKPTGSGSAFIKFDASPLGTFGDLMAVSFDWYTDPNSS